MSRSITQPPGTVNVFSAQGDTFIGHDDATAQAYKAATADARHRQASGLPPEGSPVTRPAAPAGPHFPSPGVANAALGTELAILRGKAGDRQRWLNTSQIGMGGMQIPGRATQRQAVLDEMEAIQGTITRLESLDGNAIRQWAFERGVR